MRDILKNSIEFFNEILEEESTNNYIDVGVNNRITDVLETLLLYDNPLISEKSIKSLQLLNTLTTLNTKARICIDAKMIMDEELVLNEEDLFLMRQINKNMSFKIVFYLGSVEDKNKARKTIRNILGDTKFKEFSNTLPTGLAAFYTNDEDLATRANSITVTQYSCPKMHCVSVLKNSDCFYTEDNFVDFFNYYVNRVFRCDNKKKIKIVKLAAKMYALYIEEKNDKSNALVKYQLFRYFNSNQTNEVIVNMLKENNIIFNEDDFIFEDLENAKKAYNVLKDKIDELLIISKF